MDPRFLSNEDFRTIYGKVPRLNVDLIIRSEKGILLALRSIEPYKGQWHLPGGTVYKGETIEEASLRVCKKETGLTARFIQCLGYMEFPHEVRSGVIMHTVSVAIELSVVEGELRHDEHADELAYYKEIPENCVSEHREFLQNIKIA